MALSPIALAAESYQLDSTPAAQHRAVNLYAESLPDGARSKFYLKSTPGLTLLATCGLGPVTATATSDNTFFCISKDKLYRFTDSSGFISAVDDMGFVGSFTADYGPKAHNTIAIGLAGIAVVVPPRGYVTSFAGAPPVNVITTGGGNFPSEGVSSVCYLDGYYVFTVYGGEYFFSSDLLSPSVYSGVSYVRMSSQVDFVEHGVAFKGELWMFGQSTVSVYYNSGDATTPFTPRTGGVIQVGCGSYNTVCELDGSLWWVSNAGVVYRTSGGYSAKRVSTHAIEEQLALYAGGDMRSVRACAFSHEGHFFYALTLPERSKTFVYDTTTQLWHERVSAVGGVGRWAINTASEMPARWVLGDSVDGRLWQMDRATSTEKSVAVPRLAQPPALVSHGPRAFMSRLEVEMETGLGGVQNPLLLAWSDDGGTTFSAARSLATGASGARLTRVATTRLGSFRQRILQLTGVGFVSIYGIDVDMGAGES